jgi:hypothetical protein
MAEPSGGRRRLRSPLPAIHVFLAVLDQTRDARHKTGQDARLQARRHRAALIAATSVFCKPSIASMQRLASPRRPPTPRSARRRDFIAGHLALVPLSLRKKLLWTCVLDHTIAVAAVRLSLPLIDLVTPNP